MMVICPYHKEKTASCKVYPDGGYFCFGCGAQGKWKGEMPEACATSKPIEDVKASIDHILSLPKKEVRGLKLHCDEEAYYIVWPNRSYYKRRLFELYPGAAKYKGPSGATKPHFHLAGDSPNPSTLWVVEGELNALSLQVCYPHQEILCPGGSGDFYSGTMRKNLHTFLRYTTIVLIVDNDAPGALAAIKLKKLLLTIKHRIPIILMGPDANETLVTHGCEKLREALNKGLGLQAGMQEYSYALSSPREVITSCGARA